jgi:hypothetical protein
MASCSRWRHCLQLADIGGEIAVIWGWGRDPKAGLAGTVAWVRTLAWARSGTPPPVFLQKSAEIVECARVDGKTSLQKSVTKRRRAQEKCEVPCRDARSGRICSPKEVRRTFAWASPPPPFYASADSGGVTGACAGSEDCKGVAGGRLRVIASKTRRKAGSADSGGFTVMRSGREPRVHGEE